MTKYMICSGQSRTKNKNMEEKDIITTKHHTRINRCCPYQRSKEGECASFWNTHYSGKQRMKAIEGFIAKYEGRSFNRCLNAFVNDARFKESKGWKWYGVYYSPRSYFDKLFKQDYELDDHGLIHKIPHQTKFPKPKDDSITPSQSKYYNSIRKQIEAQKRKEKQEKYQALLQQIWKVLNEAQRRKKDSKRSFVSEYIKLLKEDEKK